VDTLIPALQERGIYRTGYAGTTLREHLQLPPLADRRTAAARRTA
jgi:hypothetical protein